MTTIITKKDAQSLKKILSEKKGQEKQKGNLSKHFGKLRRGLDGLEYQQEIRFHED